MKYINELQVGERIQEIYLCKSKQRLTTKANKDYISLTLQDKTGLLDGKIWNESNAIDDFDEMDYIEVIGIVTSFQGANQLNITRVRRCSEGEYVIADYLPTSKNDINDMYSQLLSYVDSVKQPHLRKLLESFFVSDKDFAKSFKNHSAAKSVHHGFIGGLLEHTLNVANLCDFYSKQYPLINRDLLIAAALFHDIGKVKELSTFPFNDYTDEGQLLGHIFMGAEMIGEKIAQIQGFPKELELELKHCILAHHGELEYGSPKKPALIEAVALNYADNTDAKMQIMIEALEGAPVNTQWLGYNRLIESNIKRTSSN
ncbi:MAG: HD domain-containing protein [Clostridiales bacterium]|nr:HD domain-containing protein [Clostridiales bacterium]